MIELPFVRIVCQCNPKKKAHVIEIFEHDGDAWRGQGIVGLSSDGSMMGPSLGFANDETIERHRQSRTFTASGTWHERKVGGLAMSLFEPSDKGPIWRGRCRYNPTTKKVLLRLDHLYEILDYVARKEERPEYELGELQRMTTRLPDVLAKIRSQG